MLEEMLLKAGAEVFVTRKTSGTVTGLDIKKWMKNNYRKAVKKKLQEKMISAKKAKYLLRTGNKRARLKFFLSEYDRPARTDLINKFNPHLTLVIHYNTAGDLTGYKNKYKRIKEVVGIKRMSDRRKIRMIRKVFKSISEIDKDYSVVFAPGCFAKNELRNIRFRIEFLRLLLSDDMTSSVNLSKRVLGRFVRDLKVPAVG